MLSSCCDNGNLVMTDGNTLLSDTELEMLVILRMNRDFMKYMREPEPRPRRLDAASMLSLDVASM